MEKGKEKIGRRLLCGSGVGIANGLFGGGGGMLAVPMLRGLGLDEKRAHATAILLILPVSLLSFFLYAIRGAYELSLLIPTALGVTAGGGLGAALLGRLPVKAINLIFALLQLVAGLFLFFFTKG